MYKKQLYEAPDAELLEVNYEENFCQTGGNTAGNGYGDNDLGELDDDED